MHVLIILNLLIWMLIGLWLRQWCREEEALQRAQEAERRARDRRLYEQKLAAGRERRALKPKMTFADVAGLMMPFAVTLGLLILLRGVP